MSSSDCIVFDTNEGIFLTKIANGRVTLRDHDGRPSYYRAQMHEVAENGVRSAFLYATNGDIPSNSAIESEIKRLKPAPISSYPTMIPEGDYLVFGGGFEGEVIRHKIDGHTINLLPIKKGRWITSSTDLDDNDLCEVKLTVHVHKSDIDGKRYLIALSGEASIPKGVDALFMEYGLEPV